MTIQIEHDVQAMVRLLKLSLPGLQSKSWCNNKAIQTPLAWMICSNWLEQPKLARLLWSNNTANIHAPSRPAQADKQHPGPQSPPPPPPPLSQIHPCHPSHRWPLQSHAQKRPPWRMLINRHAWLLSPTSRPILAGVTWPRFRQLIALQCMIDTHPLVPLTPWV